MEHVISRSNNYVLDEQIFFSCAVVAIANSKFLAAEKKDLDINNNQILKDGTKLYKRGFTKPEEKDKSKKIMSFYVNDWKCMVEVQELETSPLNFEQISFNEDIILMRFNFFCGIWRNAIGKYLCYYFKDNRSYISRFDDLRDLKIHVCKNGAQFQVYVVKLVEENLLDRKTISRYDEVENFGARKKTIENKNDLGKNERFSEEKISLNLGYFPNYPSGMVSAADNVIDRVLTNTGYQSPHIQTNVPSKFKFHSDRNLYILHGFTHDRSEMYKNKGDQSAGCCVAAVVMNQYRPVRAWTRHILDNILSIGDKLYTMYTKYYSSVADFDDCIVQITEQFSNAVTVTSPIAMGTLSSMKPGVLNIKKALEEYFKQPAYGVVLETGGDEFFLIWQDLEERFCIFDTRECDIYGHRILGTKDRGKKSEGGGSKIQGQCCVTCSPELDGLVAHLLKKIGENRKNEYFVLRAIFLDENKPKTKNWKNFSPQADKKSWILLGTFASDDEQFDEKNRGQQDLAMAVSGIVAVQDLPPSEWTDSYVDFIVILGDRYFNWCLNYEENEGDLKMEVSDLKKDFFFNMKKASVKIDEYIAFGNKPLLPKMIQKAIENYDGAIIGTNEDLSVGIFKDSDAFYLFDATAREEENVARVIRASKPEDLADYIAGQDFRVHGVNVSLSREMTEEEVAKDQELILNQIEAPREFRKIDDNCSALFGSFKQHEKMQQSALVTLVIKKLNPGYTRTPHFIDDVLRIAMNVEDETAEFSIGANRFTISSEEHPCEQNELQSTLERLLRRGKANDGVIIRQSETFFAIWCVGDGFYFMDPRGRDPKNGDVDEDKGVAAVLWSSSLEFLLPRISPLLSQEPGNMVLDEIFIKNNLETKEKVVEPEKDDSKSDWNNFIVMLDDLWEIKGSEAENVETGTSLSIAVIAAVFSKVYLPKQWSSKLLDDIYNIATEYHSKCVSRIGTGHSLKLTEVLQEFYLSERRILIQIQDCVYAGNEDNLTKAIHKFHINCYNQSAILHILDGEYMTIFSENDFYYGVFPKSNEILRTKNAYILKTEISKRLFHEGKAEYELSWVKISVDEGKSLDPSYGVRVIDLPPMNAYKRMSDKPARAILHSSSSYDFHPLGALSCFGPAFCIVALGMPLLISPTGWTSKTVDNIILIGNKLYKESVKNHSLKNPRLDPWQFSRIVEIDSIMITADIEECTISGPVTLQSVISDDEENKKDKKKKKKIAQLAKKLTGKKEKKTIEIPEETPTPKLILFEGMRSFFSENNAGILVINKTYSMAIWKECGVIYLFEPRETDFEGLVYSEERHLGPSVMWFACLEPLVELIHKNLKDNDIFGNYELSRVLVKRLRLEKLPEIKEKHPYIGYAVYPAPVPDMGVEPTGYISYEMEYKQLDSHLSVLRGSINIDDEQFQAYSGFQGTAIAAVAIILAHLREPLVWNTEMVDAVIKHGSELHVDCSRTARTGPRNLSISELFTTVAVANFRVDIYIERHRACGIFNQLHELVKTIEEFFLGLDKISESRKVGIIVHTYSRGMAILLQREDYYLFNPYYGGIFKSYSVAKLAPIIKRDMLGTGGPYSLSSVKILTVKSLI